ncbi:MAG: helix-turn-helix domain-containing protein [Thermacetogeniaceae bacterium]
MLARVSYSVKELADATGLPKSTIYTWIRQGHIVAQRIGPRKLIIPSDEAKKLGVVSSSVR